MTFDPHVARDKLENDSDEDLVHCVCVQDVGGGHVDPGLGQFAAQYHVEHCTCKHHDETLVFKRLKGRTGA